MGLFGRKNKIKKFQEASYEVFGGFSITKNPAGYEIIWRSPNLTTIIVDSEPYIDEKVEIQRKGNKTRILSTQCKLKIKMDNGATKAYISKF